jgi:Lrp/AsnC family transcriptional regulator, leucine-responsive regulatory protein
MGSLGFAGVVMVTIELTSQAEHVLAEFERDVVKPHIARIRSSVVLREIVRRTTPPIIFARNSYAIDT